MADTVPRIIPNRFGNKPVHIDIEHPLWAESVAPEDFVAKSATVESEPVLDASEGEPDETPVRVAPRRRRSEK